MNKKELQPFLKSLLEFKFLSPWPHLNALQTFARLFAATGALYYLFRLKDWGKLFGLEAFIPKDFILTYYHEHYRPLFYFFPEAQVWAFLAYFIVVGIFVVSLFRALPFWLKALAWLIHLMFFYRNIPGVYGGDLVLNAFFILYVFSESKNPKIYPWLVFVGKWQLILVYFTSALAKLSGQSWLSGTAVGIVLNNEQMNLVSFDLLAVAPLLSAVLSWCVLGFELGSPFGFLTQKTVKVWLGFGIVMHILIAINMGLWFFALKMLAPYVLFAPEAQKNQD